MIRGGPSDEGSQKVHMKSGKSWLIVIALFVAGGLVFLYVRSPNDDAIESDVVQVKAASMPPDARLMDSPRPTRDGNSFETSWTFETYDTWGQYREWLAGHPFLDFRSIAATQPTFRRTLSGDFQHFTVEKISDGPPLRVKVSFRSIPD